MTSPRLIRHAHAVAIGGSVSRPAKFALPACTVALPVIGGFVDHRLNDVNVSHQDTSILSFASAEATAWSSESADGSSSIITRTKVKELSILKSFSARLLAARLTATRQFDSKDLTFSIDLNLDDVRYQGSRISVTADERKLVFSNSERRGRTATSMIDSLSIEGGNGEVNKNRLVLPDFGSVFVGQLVTENDAAWCTLLRLELGSPVEGVLEVCGLGAALFGLSGDPGTEGY